MGVENLKLGWKALWLAAPAGAIAIGWAVGTSLRWRPPTNGREFSYQALDSRAPVKAERAIPAGSESSIRVADPGPAEGVNEVVPLPESTRAVPATQTLGDLPDQPSPNGRDLPVGTRFRTSVDYRLSNGEPSQEELEIRAAQVSYEADRRLAMLTDRYQLTEEQQALVFPVIARTSQAYHPALAIQGEGATDAYLAALPPTAQTDALVAEPATPVPTVDSPSQDTPASSEVSGPAPAPPAATDSETTGVDNSMPETNAPEVPAALDLEPGFEEEYNAALESSLEMLEEQMAPFLDADQLAAMTEDQIDRYYWWGEILLQIDGDAAADAVDAPVAVIPEPEPAEPSDDPAPGGDSEPDDHQGGNLLGLINALP